VKNPSVSSPFSDRSTSLFNVLQFKCLATHPIKRPQILLLLLLPLLLFVYQVHLMLRKIVCENAVETSQAVVELDHYGVIFVNEFGATARWIDIALLPARHNNPRATAEIAEVLLGHVRRNANYSPDWNG